jgi:hypothetical protein
MLFVIYFFAVKKIKTEILLSKDTHNIPIKQIIFQKFRKEQIKNNPLKLIRGLRVKSYFEISKTAYKHYY